MEEKLDANCDVIADDGIAQETAAQLEQIVPIANDDPDEIDVIEIIIGSEAVNGFFPRFIVK